MFLILHGENQVKSRDHLALMIDRAQKRASRISRLEAKKINLAILEENLLANSLFDKNKLLIIEGLHSLPRSKKKNELIKFLSANCDQIDLILWEKRSLTQGMLKKFPQATIKEFKPSNHLFAWLDALNPDKKTLTNQLQLLDQASQADSAQMCFAMLARQIRLLITAKSGGKLKAHPFVIQKIHRQTHHFSLSQLLKIHHQLLQIDIKQKTSTGLLPLKAELDLLLINM